MYSNISHAWFVHYVLSSNAQVLAVAAVVLVLVVLVLVVLVGGTITNAKAGHGLIFWWQALDHPYILHRVSYNRSFRNHARLIFTYILDARITDDQHHFPSKVQVSS